MRSGKRARYALVWLCLVCLAACSGQMSRQPRFDPYEANPFFDDGASARPLVPNTVARGLLRTNSAGDTGLENGAPAQRFPFPVTMEVLQRGQERYNIFCSPCHGYDGYGQGEIVQRGFKQPASFHEERLRTAPPGYFFGVMTNGFGVMYSYASRVPPEDRWAITAYIRALQLSQNATLEDVPPAEREQLSRSGPAATAGDVRPEGSQ
jgi:cytochrome c553